MLVSGSHLLAMRVMPLNKKNLELTRKLAMQDAKEAVGGT
jgi:hypothetical protein